jgi:acyl-ACP thioesterase
MAAVAGGLTAGEGGVTAGLGPGDGAAQRRETRLELQVRGWDCGYGGPLRVLPLLNYLQEAAGESAEALGFGMEVLKAENRTWMLSRVDLRIEGLPTAGERVVVRTRPAGTERLFALRDFILEAESGATLARAVYAYLVVDLAARRPLRPERALAGHAMGEPSSAVPGHRFGAATAGAEAFSPAFPLRAGLRHIDENGHVNNAHIADWLTDALPSERRGRLGRLRLLRVDFLQEVLAGELLEAVWAPLAGDNASGEDEGSGGCVTELRRAAEVLARAETGWA